MRRETISVDGGFVCDPATHAVAPSMFPDVAYEFDSADQAANIFNLEIASCRYSRMERGVSELCAATDQAALADRGGSIVAPPQLYGTTHTLLTRTLKHNSVEARFAASDCIEDIGARIDETTRAVFRESVGNRASTMHRQMTREEQLRAGARPATVRLSVGTQHVEDILADLGQALSAVGPSSTRYAAE